MLAMLRDLVAHKGHANAALLEAVRGNGAAPADRELWDLLHHVLIADRFWVLAILERPFVHDDEARPSESFDALVDRYAGTQALEEAWLEAATEDDLAARAGERADSGRLVFGGAGPRPGLPARPRTPGAMREAAPAARRRAAAVRLHPVAGRVARSVSASSR